MGCDLVAPPSPDAPETLDTPSSVIPLPAPRASNRRWGHSRKRFLVPTAAFYPGNLRLGCPSTRSLGRRTPHRRLRLSRGRFRTRRMRQPYLREQRHQFTLWRLETGARVVNDASERGGLVRRYRIARADGRAVPRPFRRGAVVFGVSLGHDGARIHSVERHFACR